MAKYNFPKYLSKRPNTANNSKQIGDWKKLFIENSKNKDSKLLRGFI